MIFIFVHHNNLRHQHPIFIFLIKSTNMLKRYSTILLLLSLQLLNAQTKWVQKNPFEQKNFIENKGQFDDVKLPNNEAVLFTAKIDGVRYYFTKSGYTISRKEKVKKNKTEAEEKENKNTFPENEDEPEKDMLFKLSEKFCELKFDESNAAVAAENKVSNFYSYSDLKSKNKKGTIKADAFAKLIYKNIYPDIDVVFEFPKDSSGIEYSFYLHPGADARKIKMFFPDNSKFKLKKNNIEVYSEFGKIIHHQPAAYVQNTRIIVKSRFKITDNQIGFDIENNTSETIVIDPWTATPNFAGGNDAYDVDFDNQGNAYAYGGTGGGPFEVLKYSPAGALIWSFSPTLFSSYYGDFAVDRNSNNIYIVEGFNSSSGAQVIKINSNSTVLATFAGNSQFEEMWRIGFSRCTHQAVIAGGGVTTPTYQTCFLDSSLVNLSPVQYIPTANCCHDVGLLTLDNYGNCYQETNLSAGFADGLYENQLVKLPLPSLLPVTYNVNTNYSFKECSSVTYYTGSSFSNGYNGLTTSNKIVYSYDGYVLKKWDGPTGNLLRYKRISFPAANDSSLMYWGGVSADDCGNLFLGNNNFVKQYDTALTLVNTYTMPDVVFDVNWSDNGVLYVCGHGFVSALVPTGAVACTSGGTLAVTTSSTDATCASPGSATAVITGGSPPYTIVWNTSPVQNGTTITNIPPGTYIVTVSEGSCLQQVVHDTVVINAGPGAFSSTAVVTTGCGGTVNSGAITITTQNGAPPFNYVWSNGLPNSNSVTGLAPGTYTLTITDNGGCRNVYQALVVNIPTPINYSFTGSLKCFNDTTTLKIIPTGGSGPYTVNWTSPAVTGTQIHGIHAGNYAGTITDAGGCIQAFGYTLTQPLPLTAVSSANYNCAIVNSGNISVTASGGITPYTYSWTGFPADITNILSGVGSGIYTLTISDSNQCVRVIVDTIDVYTPLQINGTVTKTCSNGTSGSVTAAVTGGTGGAYQYNWTGYPGNNTNVLNNIPAGTYALSVTTGSCTASASFTILSNPTIDTMNIHTTYCQGEKNVVLLLSDAGIAIAAAPFQWYNAGVALAGGNQTNYYAPINGLNNYSFTWFHNGCMFKTTAIDSSVFQQFSGSTPTNVFSPNSDGINDLFFPIVELANPHKTYDFVTYNLQIFDRWGNKVFETGESTKGWDGNNLKNKKCDTGVYYWMVTGKTNCSDKVIEYNGFVNLER